jgi:Protein of unknown function (DUF2789)
MHSGNHSMTELFDQLGLPSDEASIASFIESNHPLEMATRFYDAAFWTPAQAAFIKQNMANDGDWAILIDSLNVSMREHPELTPPIE